MTAIPDTTTDADTFPAALADLAARFPDDDAVVAPDGRVSFAELASRVDEVAGALVAAGLAPGERVGILLPNSLRWLVGVLGAQRAGLVAVPINTWYRSAELAHLIRTADLGIVIAQATVFGKDVLAELEAAGHGGILDPERTGYRGAVLWPVDGPFPLTAAPAPQALPTADDLALILYTSGSTALPKPVPMQHGKLLRNGRAMGDRMHLRPGDRIWFAMPLFFGFGACNALPVALTHGAALCLQEKVDGDAGLEMIERERCTVLYAMPTAMRALLDAPSLATRDLSLVRTGPIGFTAEDKQQQIELLHLVEGCSAYGMTESYGFATMNDAHDPVGARLHSQGQVLPTQEVRVVDPDGRVCPPGVRGEIEIRGCVIDGYLGGDELNAGTRAADGWFRTGDLGLFDEHGNLVFAGRWKEMLKVKGINVAPMEIEGIVSAHEEVSQVYVIGLEVPGGDQEMVGVVVPEPGAAADLPVRLTEYVRSRVASYKVPSRFLLMDSAAVPQTDTGKVSKLKLRLQVEAGR
ncbi:class I adenylate-forming enzyme family protein [Pseudonocardia broussonetiae]|uniref:Acyl--CoA ligase n=1 Tax=Pseudonocardia broussonetiae TaxID=2736640 RepID=A0A6M6JRN3_9PSEU|nr:class I adenylate-forming enzyme family protein [Pseudonocardia broussonetiae]QJY49970.1 acyl--CoA ligase [Pseudonocardia broussonetiae]